jgi:RNA-binding protein 8A
MSDVEYEDGAGEGGEARQQQRLKSVAVGGGGAGGKKKGRGFREPGDHDDAAQGGNARYESLDPDAGSAGPARSVEGYVLFVTGLHEEAQEEDVVEAFAEFGDVKNAYLNLDRQTGYVKGYALIEYASLEEASKAKEGLDNTELLGQVISISWAFVRAPNKGGRRGR